MAYYCKGSILSRLEKHAEALNSLHEAQAYLRLGTNTKQLANCLYDAALSYYKQDDHESARKLLEEVLTLQEDEKERAQTGAFLLTLAGEDRAAIEDMMCRLIPAAAQRSLRLDHVDAPETKRRICDGLLSSFATQEDQDLFRASWPAFLGEPDFHFFVVDSGNATRSWPPYAYGLLKTYHDNFNEWDLLGLEAVWFADSADAAALEGHRSPGNDGEGPQDPFALHFRQRSEAGAHFQSASEALRKAIDALGHHAGSKAWTVFGVHPETGTGRVFLQLPQNPGAAGQLGL
jgi:tetratricopeptide (TPR) repeat protein